MSTETIRFAQYVDDVLTPVVSAVFSDEAATFGVRRVSDGFVIVNAGTALNPDTDPGDVGAYFYDVPGLVEGVTYEYSIKYVDDEGTDYVRKTFKGPPESAGMAVGLYADQNDVIDMIGRDNLEVISDVENDDAAVDVPRVQRGFNSTDALIHRELRKGGNLFVIPLVPLDNDAIETAKEASARLCAWWCDQNRGTRDVSPKATPKGVAAIYENHRQIAMDLLDDMRVNPNAYKFQRRFGPRQPRLVVVGTTRGAQRWAVPAGLVVPPLPPFFS